MMTEKTVEETQRKRNSGDGGGGGGETFGKGNRGEERIVKM